MNLKRLIPLALGLSLVLSLAACGGKTASTPAPAQSAEALDLLGRVKERGTLVIATEGDWAPWTYHDESDKLVGLDVEIGTLIAEGLGVQPDFQETDWDAILAGVDSGRFDIACNGVGYTPARAEKYNFSTPYAYTHKVLVVRGDNEDIHTLEDLNGKTTANSPNSTYADLGEQYGATVTYASTLTETIELLVQGRVDATINAQVSIEDYLKEHPDANIKVAAVLPGDPVAYPLQKTDDTATLLAEVDRILDEARQSGKLSEISLKYFGLDLTKPD